MTDSGRIAGPTDLVEVHVRSIPVATWARAQEHTDELLREFTLIAGQQSNGGSQDLPVRLVNLVADLTAIYGNLSAEQGEQLAAAADAGQPEIDLTYQIPAQAAGAIVQLRDLLDEADRYCRAGEYLLTLATPPELVRFRNWYLDEVAGQLQGRPPTPWPQYTG